MESFIMLRIWGLYLLNSLFVIGDIIFIIIVFGSIISLEFSGEILWMFCI